MILDMIRYTNMELELYMIIGLFNTPSLKTIFNILGLAARLYREIPLSHMLHPPGWVHHRSDPRQLLPSCHQAHRITQGLRSPAERHRARECLLILLD